MCVCVYTLVAAVFGRGNLMKPSRLSVYIFRCLQGGSFDTISMFPGYHDIGCVRDVPRYRDTDDFLWVGKIILLLWYTLFFYRSWGLKSKYSNEFKEERDHQAKRHSYATATPSYKRKQDTSFNVTGFPGKIKFPIIY